MMKALFLKNIIMTQIQKNLKSVKNNSLNVKNKLMQMKMILNVYHAIHR